MSAKQKLYLAFMTCISGVILVGCMSRSRTASLIHHDLLAESDHAAVDLHALHQLQKGDTKGAVRTLERNLNIEKIFIETDLVATPVDRRDTNVLRLMEKILVYQTNHSSFWDTNAGNRLLDGAWRPAAIVH